ncbi:MAG: amidohydrolase [Firmicutes bacterium]|nr:amidohydrolase [Bacillota bacterium]
MHKTGHRGKVDILISGAQVISPREGRPLVLPKGDIAVAGSEVVYVGSSPAPQEFRSAAKVIDGSGLIALPGLVNAHTHAAMTMFRGFADDMPLMEWLTQKIWPAEARLEADDVYWGTMLACVEMIRAGVTTFADMYFFMDETAKAVERTGIRASLSRGLIGSASGADKAIAEGRELCERWNGACGGRITSMLGPHAPYTCPKDFLEKVMEVASELGVGMHIHLSETEGEVRECRNLHGGMSPIELMDSYGLFEFPVLAAHCVHVSERDIEILSAKGVGVAHNPGCNMKIASGIAPVPKMLKAGVRVGLGTDGAASNNNLDLLEEARIAAFLHKLASNDPTVLAAPEALYLATLGSARALRLEAQVGTLESGKKADIILMDSTGPHMYPHHDMISHIVYSARSSDVRTVIIDGKVVMEDGALTVVDEKEVLARAEERAQALVRR